MTIYCEAIVLMKEADIRPEKLINRYLALSAQDANVCFSDSDRFGVLCVGCGSSKQQPQFTKNNFQYVKCDNCGSLYQSPRPTEKAFEGFYRDSVSSSFWADEFFPVVAESRREKIFKPRVERLTDFCRETGVDVTNLIEVGAGYGIFLEEWKKIHPEVKAIAIEPSVSLAKECRNKGFDVIEDVAENVTGLENHADLVVCFEVVEHVYDPLAFMGVLVDMARPGGYVFISTLCVDGFDIQLLWDKSKSIFPPHHINFLSIQGFDHLFKRAGLEDVNIITPGVLDVDIVINASKTHPEILDQHRFFKHIISNNTLADNFQKFLSDNCLSSHAWIIGKKPEKSEGHV